MKEYVLCGFIYRKPWHKQVQLLTVNSSQSVLWLPKHPSLGVLQCTVASTIAHPRCATLHCGF